MPVTIKVCEKYEGKGKKHWEQCEICFVLTKKRDFWFKDKVGLLGIYIEVLRFQECHIIIAV